MSIAVINSVLIKISNISDYALCATVSCHCSQYGHAIYPSVKALVLSKCGAVDLLVFS